VRYVVAYDQSRISRNIADVQAFREALLRTARSSSKRPRGACSTQPMRTKNWAATASAEDWRLAEMVGILAESKHRDALEGKRDALAAVLARHPDKDAVQTARDLEKYDEQIVNGPAFFESWLDKARKVRLPERSYTADEAIRRSLKDGESCGHDDCSICGDLETQRHTSGTSPASSRVVGSVLLTNTVRSAACARRPS
jgi:hypothetical protein